MGSPTIFNGKFTKLLTNKSILNSDGSLLQYDGAKNYIPYAQFEQGVTTGWSLFNTTLTGGLPTGSVSAGAASLALTATSTNPLAGSYSMQLAAGTSWTAGQGVISSAFTIDRADLNKYISFKIYYEPTVGGGSANWSGTLGSQSLAIYIYDVTASAWVQPIGFLGMNTASGSGYVTGFFKTSTTSGQQYQIAIVALQAVASPLTITVDQVFVGPQNNSVANTYVTSTSGPSITSTAAVVKFNNSIIDRTSSYSSSTGLFTVPITGIYQVSGFITASAVSMTAGQFIETYIYKNGALYADGGITYAQATQTLAWRAGGSSVLVSCVAGDTLAIWGACSATTTLSTSAGFSYASFKQVGI